MPGRLCVTQESLSLWKGFKALQCTEVLVLSLSTDDPEISVTWGDHELGVFEQDFGLELSSQKWQQPPLKPIPKLPTSHPAHSVILWNQEQWGTKQPGPAALSFGNTSHQAAETREWVLWRGCCPPQRFSPDLTRPATQDPQKPFLPPPPLEWFSPAQDLSRFLKTHQFPCNNFWGPVVFQWNLKNKNLGSLHHGSSNV